MEKVQSLDPLFDCAFSLTESFEEKVIDTIYKVSKKLDTSSQDTVFILSLENDEGIFFKRKKRLLKLKCFKELKRLYKIKGWSHHKGERLLLKTQL